MVSAKRVSRLLEPFGLDLRPEQISQVLVYLELLARWNERINLTAIRDPEECVTRHFGESLYLARWVELQGALLDIGSGAGFPGLALKIVAPRPAATLLEPVAKKRAFLKEATRGCGFSQVEVRGERIEEFSRSASGQFDLATSRGVGEASHLASHALRCLKPNGLICLWIGRDQAPGLSKLRDSIVWREPIPVPLSREREIWVGCRR